VFMDNLDEQVLAIIQRYMDQQKTLTDEGIKMALPSVDMREIKASLQKLQDQGTILGMPLNAYVPYIKKGSDGQWKSLRGFARERIEQCGEHTDRRGLVESFRMLFHPLH
jgi:hypothetical protein